VTVRFLADENLDSDILDGLLGREPTVDIVDVKTAGLRGTKDADLLELAFEQDRIIVTYDRRTMPRHFKERMAAGKPTPGVFIVPQQESAIGETIEWLLLVWTASQADEWRGQIIYLPIR
jgi:Domain of unknown function (DUF5615)